VVTVIDAVNFRGYEDSSPSAKVNSTCTTLTIQIQAKYTDLLIINKHQLLSEREYDDMLDHLLTLNDETPYIRVGPSPDNPLKPELVFGLDTKLFLKEGEERGDWEALAGAGAGPKGHIDEVETKSVWRGGAKPGSSKAQGKKRAHGHEHEQGAACDGCASEDDSAAVSDTVVPLNATLLKAELDKLPFEIYRGTYTRRDAHISDARSERLPSTTSRLLRRQPQVVYAYPQLGVWTL
jgi:G3E family GTPase